MIEDDIVLSYGEDEELPEITIRKKTKIKKNKTSSAIVTMLYEEGKRVSWVYLLSLIVYFSAVALELYIFLSQNPQVISNRYDMSFYEGMSYEYYLIRALFTIKSLYIGLGILLIVAALVSVILWHGGKTKAAEMYKTSFSEMKERSILYTIRFFIAFIGYLSFIGGYFISLYGIYSLSINGMENNDIIQYSILFMGGYSAIPAIYLNRYIIVTGVLTTISLLFLAAIARNHKNYKIFTTAIIAFPLLGAFGFLLYKNNYLYYSEKKLLLIGVFLMFFLGAVFIAHKVSAKISMNDEDTK